MKRKEHEFGRTAKCLFATVLALIPAVVTNAQSNIPIGDVTGLQSALNLRIPVGTGFAVNRAAVINPTGGLDAAIGLLTDCLHVDGTSGPCLDNYIDDETPTGTIDGSNVSFTLSTTPAPQASLALFRNGLRIRNGVDFNLSGNVVTFLSCCAPGIGDVLSASYRAADAAGGSIPAVVTGSTKGVEFVPARFIAQLTNEQARADVVIPVGPVDFTAAPRSQRVPLGDAPPVFRSLRELSQRQKKARESTESQERASLTATKREGKPAGFAAPMFRSLGVFRKRQKDGRDSAKQDEPSVRRSKQATADCGGLQAQRYGRVDSADTCASEGTDDDEPKRGVLSDDDSEASTDGTQLRSLRLLTERSKSQ
jgi:hypothetical protein